MPALYYRALLPKNGVSGIAIPDPPEHPVVVAFGKGSAADGLVGVTAPPLKGTGEHPVVAYSDASGGDFSSDPRLRRVGWGAAVWDAGAVPSSSPPRSGILGALPGRRQTVNRGELWAAIQALRLCSGFVRLVVDSKYVERGFNRLLAGARRFASNRDLWGVLRATVVELDLTVVVVKVESHLDRDPARRAVAGVSVDDIAGNLFADTLADQAADDCKLSVSVTRPVLDDDRMAATILRRNAAILQDVASLDQRPRAPRRPRKVPLTMEQRVAASAHAAVWLDGRWRCSRCCATPPKQGSAVRAWLATACVPPTTAAGGGTLIGTHYTHPSHALAFASQFSMWYCRSCGMVGREHLRGLAAPCRTASRAGLQNLSRLAKDLAPGGSVAACTANRGRIDARPRRTSTTRRAAAPRWWNRTSGVRGPAGSCCGSGAPCAVEPLGDGAVHSGVAGDEPAVRTGQEEPVATVPTEWVRTIDPSAPRQLRRARRFCFPPG